MAATERDVRDRDALRRHRADRSKIGQPMTPVELETDSNGTLNAQRDAPVGGQAVLEGVMMRGVSNWAVAVRKPTAEQLSEHERSPEEPALGEIEVSTFGLNSVMKRHRLLRLPIIGSLAKEALRLAGQKLPIKTKFVKRESDLFES